MELITLKDLLSDYPLNAFVGTPKAFCFDKTQLNSDMERVDTVCRDYLHSIADLIEHRDEFLSDNVANFKSYLSRVIGTSAALKNTLSVCEDMTNLFENKTNWARGLALQSMDTILDNITSQLRIISNRVKGSRFVSRARDTVSYIISQKIPELLYILSTMIAIEVGQAQPSEIVAAIGKGIVAPETC